MARFGDLLVGDLFNTKTYRGVKKSDDEAICVFSALVNVGDIVVLSPEEEVITLWTGKGLYDAEG